MSNRIWITWEYQRRNRSLSKALNCDLYEVISPNNNAFFRYIYCLKTTWRLLKDNSESVIFAQNPSIALAFFIALYSKLFGRTAIIDCHNAGLRPAEGRYTLLNRIAEYTILLTPLTIVTNIALSQQVALMGGKPYVLPDPIPELETTEKAKLDDKFPVFFICTYADDEPYREVFEAAKYVDSDIHIYVSGNFEKIPDLEIKAISKNITLTGYLSNQDYAKTINGAKAVIDLTTRSNCLVCGAYESIAAHKPLLLSTDKTSEALFNKGVVYTDNTSNDIAKKLNFLRENHRQLQREVSLLKEDMLAKEQHQLHELNTLINNINTH